MCATTSERCKRKKVRERISPKAGEGFAPYTTYALLHRSYMENLVPERWRLLVKSSPCLFSTLRRRREAGKQCLPHVHVRVVVLYRGLFLKVGQSPPPPPPFPTLVNPLFPHTKKGEKRNAIKAGKVKKSYSLLPFPAHPRRLPGKRKQVGVRIPRRRPKGKEVNSLAFTLSLPQGKQCEEN